MQVKLGLFPYLTLFYQKLPMTSILFHNIMEFIVVVSVLGGMTLSNKLVLH